MTNLMHYGKIVDSETPITGVISNNNIEFLNDEIFDNKSINLTFENWKSYEHPTKKEIENYENYNDDNEYLIGDWKRDRKTKLFEPNKNGKNGYSAIVRESVTQVVFSKNTKRCALCSPCYPGQGDLDSAGEFLAYCLPDDLMGIK